MNRNRLNEDKHHSKLPVRFSYKIYQQIKDIENLNQNNIQSLSQWIEYLDELKNYISNRAIAWNYNGRNIKFPNGTFFIRDFNYNVGYTIKTNEMTNSSFVYVFMINLKSQDFGLKVPSVTESLNRIIENVLNKYLKHTNLNESTRKHTKIIKQKDLENIINECVDRCLRKYLRENSFTNQRRSVAKGHLFLESQQSNLGDFIQKLYSIFNVKLDNYKYYGKEGKCMAYITTDTFDRNNNDFKKLMDEYQVFISEIDEFDAPEGTIQVCFESKYPKNVTKEVYKDSSILYHLTRPSYVKQIAKTGLKPIAASQFRKCWYPERIYLLTDRCSNNDIKTYARQLGTSYIVICDIKKMGRNYDFYKDPQSLESFSVFTDKPIPPESIEIKRVKDFYN